MNSPDEPIVIASFEGPDGYYELVVEDQTLYKVYASDPDRPREEIMDGFGRWYSQEHSWEELEDREE